MQEVGQQLSLMTGNPEAYLYTLSSYGMLCHRAYGVAPISAKLQSYQSLAYQSWPVMFMSRKGHGRDGHIVWYLGIHQFNSSHYQGSFAKPSVMARNPNCLDFSPLLYTESARLWKESDVAARFHINSMRKSLQMFSNQLSVLLSSISSFLAH
jgi:hypothetical protein